MPTDPDFKNPDDVFVPHQPGAEICHRRRLPHWEEDLATYFVTFHTADSLPRPLWEALAFEKAEWMHHHPQPWSPEVWAEHRARFEGKVQRWLDAGHGACPLSNPTARTIVTGTLHHGDGSRYRLDAYVVMPNHVHSILQPLASWRLPQILHGWKSFSSHALVKAGLATSPVWMPEYFDYIVRSRPQLQKFRDYVAQNPGKARLRDGQFALWQRECPLQTEAES